MQQFNKKNQRIKLKKLSKQKYIIITKSSKDKAFVIMDVKDFVNEKDFM